MVGAMANRDNALRRATSVKRRPLCSGVVVAACGAAALLGPDMARAANWTLYDSYTQSYSVGYASQGNPNLTLKDALAGGGLLSLAVKVNGGNTLFPTMDTGSTGVAISANLLSLASPSGEQGWVFYNSTGLLLTGVYNTVTLTLLGGKDAAGNPATVEATLPILVVTGATCLGIGANAQDCNAGNGQSNTLMMGVGFDRNTMGTGAVNTSNPSAAASYLNNAPTTSQAYNPFLNIAGMSSGDLRRGYIVTPDGVALGLTAANTSAAAYTYGQLALASAGQNGAANNWQAVQATVTAGTVRGTGTLLMDTGVSDAFIGLPGAPTTQAANGTLVTLSLVGGSATYSFVVGDTANPQTPNPVYLFNPASTFVNSSLHTYAGFNVLFDADGGFVGIAANGFSGATNAAVTQLIAASGTLALTQDFATDLPVLLLSASTISTPATATFNSSIFGAGSLTLAGGTIILNGAVSHTGGTLVSRGASVLNGTLTGSLTIAPAGTFQNASNGYAVAAGQTLANAGTFLGALSGAALVNAGTLINSGSLAGNVSSTGSFTNSGTVSGTVTTSGSFTNSGRVGALLTNSGTATNTGTGTLSGGVSNSGTFLNAGLISGTVSTSGTFTTSGVVTGALSNSGILINSGTLAGTVTNTGALANNGTISGTLDNGGTLSGNGSVGVLAVRSGAVVSPGNSIGTTIVAGNATFQPGSALLVELGAPGESDRLVVGGTLTAGGASMVLVPGAGFTPQLGATYAVISAGAIASNFTVSSAAFGSVGALYPFLGGSLAGGTLTLNRSAVPFAAYARTRNEAAVAVAAETLPLSSSLAQSLATLPSTAVPGVFTTLSGEAYASAQSVLQTQSSYVRGAVIGRLSQAADGALAGGPRAVALDASGATLWGQAYGGWGSTASDGNASAVTRSIGGFLMGLDGKVGEWRLGLAGGYGQSDFSLDSAPGSGSSDTYDIALYAGRRFGGDANGAFTLRAGLAYSWHDLQVNRTAVVPGQAAGLSQAYGAGYGATTAQAFGELGYAFALKGAGAPLTVEPFAGLSYVALATNGFTETPSPATLGPSALTAQSSTFDTLSTTLGVRASTVLAMGAAPPLTLSGTLGWQHAFGDLTPTTTFAFAAGSLPFTVAGAPLAQDALVLGAGIGAKLGETLEVSLAYSGQLASGMSENAVKGTLAWKF